jgi:hypothetical protein
MGKIPEKPIKILDFKTGKPIENPEPDETKDEKPLSLLQKEALDMINEIETHMKNDNIAVAVTCLLLKDGSWGVLSTSADDITRLGILELSKGHFTRGK